MKKYKLIFTVLCLFSISFLTGLHESSNPINVTSFSGYDIDISNEDKNTVWISGSSGIKKYDIIADSWSSYTTSEGLPNLICTEVLASKDSIWIGTTDGAGLIDLNTTKISNFLPKNPFFPNYYPAVYSFGLDKDILYVGTDAGLFGINKASLDTVLYYNINNGLGENYIYSIVTDDKYIWAATAYSGGYIWGPPPTGGLSRIDKANGAVVNYRYGEENKPSYLYSMIQMGDLIWTESRTNLWLFNKTTKEFTNISKPEFRFYSRIKHFKEAFLTDPDKVSNAFNNRTKFFNNTIWLIAEDHDHNKSLLQLDAQTNSIVKQIPIKDFNDYFIQDSVLYLLSNDSLYYRLLNSDKLKTISTPFLPERSCYSIAATNDNAYIGSYNSLTDFSIKDNSIRVMNYADLIRDIQVDDDELWVSGNSGLEKININSWEIVYNYLPDARVLFCKVDNNYIWASATDGFYKVNKSSYHVKKKNYQSELNTFGSPAITGVVVNEPFIWLSFSGSSEGERITGILKVDKYNLNLIDKYYCTTAGNKISDIVDYGHDIICAGEKILKFNKDSLTFHTFIDFDAEEFELNNNILWATYGRTWDSNDTITIKAFNVKTGNPIFTINESEGLLRDKILDMYVTNDYIWCSMHGGISGFNISSLTEIEEISDHREVTPQSIYLYQNYPNPFNSSTRIKFYLKNRSFVNLSVYDNLGRKVVTLIDEQKYPGDYSLKFNSQGLSSGVYYYRIKTKESDIVRKMLVIK